MRKARRNDSLKKFNSNYGDNKKMNSDVYALRRDIINIIYQLNDLIEGKFPRVQVRVTDNGKDNKRSVLGVATMGNNEIWICESAFALTKERLYHVVLHELCHTWFSTEHYDSCHLMAPRLPHKLSNAKAKKAFLKYAKKAGYKVQTKSQVSA